MAHRPLLGAAAVFMVTAYLFTPDPWAPWRGLISLGAALVGVLFVLITVLVLDRFLQRDASAELRATFCSRWTTLDSILQAYGTDQIVWADSQEAQARVQATLLTATTQCDFLGQILRCKARRSAAAESTRGSADQTQWTLGSEWIELWTRLHAAEEALFLLESTETVVAKAVILRRRVIGSNIENHDELLRQLSIAAIQLGGWDHFRDQITEGLPADFSDPLNQQAAGVARATNSASPVPDSSARRPSPEPDPELRARTILRDIQVSVNYFRDMSRWGLIRTREHLLWAGAITSIVAFALVALPIMSGVAKAQLTAAVSYFLVGALVGLFSQLRDPTVTMESEADFGLNRARLFTTPLLSGIAAVVGVFITAVLLGTLGSPASPAATASPPVTLSSVFNLNKYPYGLVIAAVFGLAPNLLIDRLQSEANRYKDDLRSTTGESRGGA